MPEKSKQPINRNSKTKGKLNQNAMILEQIDGCCNMIDSLFEQLIPQTEDVIDCKKTHKAWQKNNFKHLRGAFE